MNELNDLETVIADHSTTCLVLGHLIAELCRREESPHEAMQAFFAPLISALQRNKQESPIHAQRLEALESFARSTSGLLR